VFKTITSGDGGMIATNNEDLYKRAFAIHDQGHLPLRQGVEQGSRTVIGLDFRMTELSAAVLLAQLKKLENIKSKLKERKKHFKDGIKDLNGLRFRTLPDPEGELGTILTVFLPDAKIACEVGKELGSGVVSDSGWHVYNNMEHIIEKKVVDSMGCPFSCPYYKEKGGNVQYKRGMLPKTDELLSRAINISIGVVDSGLGAGFGIDIRSKKNEIDEKVEKFRKAVKKYM
jgi:8-amino-3,8-dideoxy-alpha-D-manno-octulosonate transaminase